MRIAIDWARRRREIAIFVAVGSFLAFIDPYDATRQLPGWGRWIYWTGLVIFGLWAGQAATWMIGKLLPKLHSLLNLLIVSLITTLAVTGVILIVQGFIGSYVPRAFWPQLYGLVWVISAAMAGIGYLVGRSFDDRLPVGDDAGDGISAFLERLPVKYRAAALYAVSSEDHYLRVHTDRGEALILMRLADAVRELGRADGLQTHRSWWVATDGVADMKREGGRIFLILKSGVEAPVSRSYAKSVREKGLI